VPSFKLSPATAQALELPGLLALVAHRSATDLGRERVLALTPEDDEDRLCERRRAYEETERLLAERPLVPLLERPLGPLLQELERGGYNLGGRELLLFVDLLRASAEAAQRVRTADPACEALAARLEGLPSLDELRRQLEKTFDRRGEIREDATPRLSELRGKPLVVHFIYTGCIQVCPASTAFLATAVAEAERTHLLLDRRAVADHHPDQAVGSDRLLRLLPEILEAER